MQSSATFSKAKRTLAKIVQHEVKNRLHHVLYNQFFLDSSIQKPSDTTTSYRALDLQVSFGDISTLDKSINIATIFDQLGRRFLILGAAGAGKTTLLLNLTKVLLEQNLTEYTPIPILLSLSTWKDEKQSIRNWIIAQLQEKYGVREDISKHWFSNIAILPFLDDLDKVSPEKQDSCVQAINLFLREQWQHGVIICSSISDRLQVRIGLSRAIALQLLNDEFICNYIQQTGDFSLWENICNDNHLRDLIKTPLLLNILLLIRDQFSLEQWRKLASSEEQLDYLFETYIEEMLARSHSKTWQYSDEATKHWLGWLAKRLIDNEMTEFYLEKLEPHWLENRKQKMISGIILGLLYGLLAGAILGLMNGVFYGLVFVPSSVLLFGLLGTLINPKTAKSDGKNRQFLENSTFSVSAMLQGSVRGFRIGLVAGLILGMLFGGLGFWFKSLENDAIANSIVEFIAMLAFVIVAGLVIGLIIGSIVGLICGFIFGLISGFKNSEIVNKVVPNQGIKQSFVNSLCILFIGFLLGSIPSILSSEFLNVFLGYTLFLSFNFTSLTGGIAVLGHLSLRVVLTKTHKIPWNYARFLDYSVDRLFLQRVGSRYHFSHDLLRQHFAKKYGN